MSDTNRIKIIDLAAEVKKQSDYNIKEKEYEFSNGRTFYRNDKEKRGVYAD